MIQNLLLFFFCFSMLRYLPTSTLFPYTTLFRSPTWATHLERPRPRGYGGGLCRVRAIPCANAGPRRARCRLDRDRSEEHTSELQSPDHLVCRLLLEKKNITN